MTVKSSESMYRAHHDSRLGLHEVEHLAHVNDGLLGLPVHCAQEIEGH